MSVKWIACELHTHTLHSDGRFTPESLAQSLKERGFEAAALTDHNSTSGVNPFAAAARSLGITPIPALELTTFHGHVLSLGTAEYVEWRDVPLAGGLEILSGRVRAAGGLCGLAHPFDAGGFLCTGCHMDYDTSDLRAFDYVEVWNGHEMHESPFNRRAYRWWKSLLDKGARVPATAGRDWHGPDAHDGHAATYVGIPEREAVSAQALAGAVSRGRVAVTRGLLPELSLEGGALRARVLSGRGGAPRLSLRIAGQGDTLIAEADAHQGFDRTFSAPDNVSYAIAELWDGETLIGFTSPCYL